METNRGGKPLSFGIFTIASAYVGTVVGAGFASGQEVLRFFGAYGWLGLVGIGVVTLLFFFFGYSVLLFGHRLQAHSHVEVVRFTNGKILGFVIDLIITVFLFGALSAMIAGAGAIVEEQFGVSALWGTIAMTVITLLTVIAGTRGVVNAISGVAPFLLLSVLFLSIYSLAVNPVLESEVQLAETLPGATPGWLLSAVNYASYNMVIAVAVLTPMGARAKSRKDIFWSAFLGALGLGVGILAIYLCLLTNMTEIFEMEVPMVEIASNISKLIQYGFTVILFAEVYTTAVGNLYGFVRRVPLKVPKIWLILIPAFLAFLIAQLGFSNMVRYLYPAVGYGGILFFLGVLYAWIAKRKSFMDLS